MVQNVLEIRLVLPSTSLAQWFDLYKGTELLIQFRKQIPLSRHQPDVYLCLMSPQDVLHVKHNSVVCWLSPPVTILCSKFFLPCCKLYSLLPMKQTMTEKQC
jgi:hypothetical protein